MDTTIDRSDIAQYSAAPAVAVSLPEDDLAFFSALWFWIPAGLAVWSAIIWAVTRIV